MADAEGEDSDGLERALVHGQPQARDVEGQRLLAAVRAKMFTGHAAVPIEIGRYRVLRRIGQGGMGVVYEAHDPELDRKVALKLVRPGPGVHRDRPARLLREAQALALLSHPNVVPVYDSGRHADQVFLAMAYIEGKTLDLWQAQLRPWPQVVAHYLAAGRGLAAAHAAGLVHRDFKPANVMLADDGRVLVMDFGLVAGRPSASDDGAPKPYDVESVIARLDEARLPRRDDPAAWEALTRSGQIVGTYSYMPPEQQEGKAAEALADQFAFCTAFLEALQGEFPFVGDSPEELYESKRVGRFVEDPPRPDLPRALRRVLLRGLSAHPDQRWPDMETLLQQVERSVRRRWWLAVSAGAAVVVAGGMTWAMLAGGSSCDPQRELDEVYGPTQRAAIRTAMQQTGLPYADHSAQGVLTRLDDYADAWRRAFGYICASQPEDTPDLDRRRRCLEERRRALSALAQVLAEADARVTEDGIAMTLALPAVERCSSEAYLAREVQWPRDPRRRDRVDELRTQVASARALTEAGRFSEARRVLDDVEKDPDTTSTPALRSEAELALGILQVAQGEFEDACKTLEQAYFRATGAGHYEVAADAGTRLVAAYGSGLGRTVDARAWARHAHDSIEELGADSVDEAYLDHARGELFLRDGQYEAAQAAFSRARETFEARWGPEHASVAMALHSSGATAQAQGKFDDAVTDHRRALDIIETIYGESHPARARSLSRLARAEQLAGHRDEALAHLRASLKISRDVFGDEHIAVAMTLRDLGMLLQQAGELEKAATVQRQALAAFEAVKGRDDVAVGMALVDLAGTLNRLERWLGATTAIDRADAVFGAQLEADDPYRVRLSIERATTLRGQGQSEAAQSALVSAIESCDRRPDEAGPCVVARTTLAELLVDGDPQRARTVADAARARFEASRLRDIELSRRLQALDRLLPPAPTPPP